jgi:hypothetical protein
MLRLVSRLFGYWLVAAALVLAVVDGAKSIAASAFIATPLSQSWATVTALGAAGAEPLPLPTGPWPLDVFFTWLFAAPTAAVVLALGMLFLAAGQKRRRPVLGREFAT